MPFPRPAMSELRRQAASDINAALPGVDALLRYSNLGILGDVLAAMAGGHYGYLDWIALNAVPFTATGEHLEGWAALKGITRKPATPAAGSARFAAVDGKTIPAGYPISRADGVSYTTTAASTAAGGQVLAPIRAEAGGRAGNTDGGTRFTLGGGIGGIAAIGEAADAVTGGADLEADEALRSRMIAAYAAPPQGGSIADYVGWTLAVAGVTRAWVRPSAMGPGTLGIYFMMDGAQAAHGGFPQGTDGAAIYEARAAAATGDQLAVANALFAKQSVTALIYAVAPKPNVIGLTLAGIAGASPATKADISAAAASALTAAAVPGGTTNISAIEAAIAGVAETGGFVITTVTASAGAIAPGAAGNIVSAAGALPVLGSVTYV